MSGGDVAGSAEAAPRRALALLALQCPDLQPVQLVRDARQLMLGRCS